MLGSLLGGAASFKHLTGSVNDDHADRLNHLWTVFLLGLFAVFVTTGSFVGDPIHCWVPAEFSGAWTDYTKSVCWVKNTYFIPLEETIPTDIALRENAELQYYQWIPLIFMFMALLFKIPNLVWRAFNDGSGLNLEKIVNLASDTQMGSSEDRVSTIQHLALYLDRWLEGNRDHQFNFAVRMRHKISRVCFFICSKREGTYLTGFYVFTKALYLANVIGQFFLLNAFLSMEYNFYGAEVISHLTQHGSLKESPRFPRVTLCDFQIRQMQNLLRYTVQCVLPINLFNEKIFVFLWFWLVLVAAITSLSLFMWLYRILFRVKRGRFVRKYLRMLNLIGGGSDKQLSEKFADGYLRDDGIFVLRLIGNNSTDLVVTDLIGKLWKIFINKPYNKKHLLMDGHGPHDGDNGVNNMSKPIDMPDGHTLA